MNRPIGIVVLSLLILSCADKSHVEMRTPSIDNGMVLIPAGNYYQGCAPDNICESGEASAHSVYVNEFYIDRREVTASEYMYYLYSLSPILEGRGGPKSLCNLADFRRRRKHPMNCVSWEHSKDYCSWLGKRLPTEAEWEKAARGTDLRPFPWGHEPPTCEYAVMRDGDIKHAGCGRRRTFPVCSKPKGNSPYGLCDMSGNVSEWVVSKQNEKDEDMHIAKGGSFRNGAEELYIWMRHDKKEFAFTAGAGFRCARSKSDYNLKLLPSK